MLYAGPLRCDNPGRGLLWAPSVQINDLPRALSVRRPPEPGGAGAVFVEDDMRNTTTVVIAAGAVLAAVIVTRTPGQQEYGATGRRPAGNGRP